MDRDPRQDPRPGDVLSKVLRKSDQVGMVIVVDVHDDIITFARRNHTLNLYEKLHQRTLMVWREQANDAVVMSNVIF